MFLIFFSLTAKTPQEIKRILVKWPQYLWIDSQQGYRWNNFFFLKYVFQRQMGKLVSAKWPVDFIISCITSIDTTCSFNWLSQLEKMKEGQKRVEVVKVGGDHPFFGDITPIWESEKTNKCPALTPLSLTAEWQSSFTSSISHIPKVQFLQVVVLVYFHLYHFSCGHKQNIEWI